MALILSVFRSHDVDYEALTLEHGQHPVYLGCQGSQGFCGVAGEISGRQDWTTLASSPLVQMGQRSAMKPSVYEEKQTCQRE